MRRPRLRFSLRVLFVATAILAAGVYWFSLPTLQARRYVQAINSGDYATADRMSAGQKGPFGQTGPFPGDMVKREFFHPHATLRALSWRDLWAGERQLYIVVSEGNDGGFVSGGMDCRATRSGIAPGLLMP